MKVVIIGCESQIGETFNYNTNFHIYKLTKKQLNITNLDQSAEIIKKIKPNVVINTAAFTDVDLAEKKIEFAFEVNALGPKNLAQICQDINAHLIHFSTDYVFDGKKYEKYHEDDIVNPISIYGKSKLQGEKNIINNCDKYCIIRISWLYGQLKKNFVTQILDLLKKNIKLNVVDDQYSLPTNNMDLFDILISILNKIDKNLIKSNIYNYSGFGEITSRYEFARSIANLYFNGDSSKYFIKPISSILYYDNQIRPMFSALNCNKIYKELNIKPLDWKYSLERTINQLKYLNK